MVGITIQCAESSKSFERIGDMMDRVKLKQIQHLKSEIHRLQKIADDKTVPLHDIVKGSSPNFPYSKTVFHIEGICEPEVSEKLDRINDKIKRKVHELIKLREEIIDWIMEIEESRLRQIFIMRYIEGSTWEQISMNFGSTDEQYARKIHDRFLEKLN